MLRSASRDPGLQEARQHTSDALAFLAQESLPRHRRIQLALRCLSGWIISNLKPTDKQFLEHQLVAVSAILSRNGVKDAADYKAISSHDLDEIEEAIRALGRRFGVA